MNLPRWTVVTDYPRWPSPYFQQFEAALAPHLDVRFSSALPAVDTIQDRLEVVNLHRLARLYRGADRQPDAERAEQLLADLDDLQRAGWRLAWTVHNLYPIYSDGPTHIDRRVAEHLLARADVVITHTESDAAYLAPMRAGAPIVAAGSGGLDAIPNQLPSPQIRLLADFLAAAPVALLVLGNLAAYKGLEHLVEIFLAATHEAHLVIAGRPADPGTACALAAAAERSYGRIMLHAEQVPPGTARYLCSRATALVAPYRTDGAFGFFRNVLHPSSVAMAVGFGTRVIAPDLPSTRELTAGKDSVLYRNLSELADALAELDQGPFTGGAPPGSGLDRWPQVAATYRDTASILASPPDGSLR